MAFRLADGARLQRRFDQHTPMRVLFDFVEAQSGRAAERISLATSFPKRTFTDPNDSRSLLECGLHPAAVLFVHEADS